MVAQRHELRHSLLKYSDPGLWIEMHWTVWPEYESWILASACCSGSVGRRPWSGLSDRGGGEPTGRQQHIGELHCYQQHWGEWHWWGDHVSGTDLGLKLWVLYRKRVPSDINLPDYDSCLRVPMQVRGERCRLCRQSGKRRRRTSWRLGRSHRYSFNTS